MEIQQVNEAFINLATSFGYNKIEASSIIVNESNKPFLTFSPIQHVLNKFETKKEGSEFVLQDCMRNIPFETIQHNPLATQYQLLYGLFSYDHQEIKEILQFITEFFCTSLKLNKKNIYVMYSEKNDSLGRLLESQSLNKAPYDENRLICTLPLDVKAYYVKIVYYFNNGLIPISNLALINQNKNRAQIDSIFYPERIKFILDGKDNIYQTNFYFETIKKLDTFKIQDFGLKCGIVSYLRSILALYINGIVASNNKIGYVLKSMERELFSYLFVNEIEINIITLTSIFSGLLETINLKTLTNLNIQEYSILFVDNYTKYINTIKRNKKQVLKDLKNKSSLNSEDIFLYKDRYGINKLILEYILRKEDLYDTNKHLFKLEKREYPYYFDVNKNQVKDPYEWLLKRRNTKLYKR